MNDEATNGRRQHHSAQDKVAILREHLIEGVPVSKVCDQHGLNPTVFYRWQKEFFEHGAAAFQRTDDAAVRQLEGRVQFLEGKLGRKDEVIAELMEDHVRLKKSLGES
jgi:transposase-like protein